MLSATIVLNSARRIDSQKVIVKNSLVSIIIAAIAGSTRKARKLVARND